MPCRENKSRPTKSRFFLSDQNSMNERYKGSSREHPCEIWLKIVQ